MNLPLVNALSEKALIGPNVAIWNFSQVREFAQIGENTSIGSFVYIDSEVRIGKNCKIQNGALIYHPADIGDGVFIGPGAIFTNDHNPRAVNYNGDIKGLNDWQKSGVSVLESASIGAGAICIAPITIGKWSLVGAGAVVTRDVPDFALVVGNPARQIGWVGHHGVRLVNNSEFIFECPITSRLYEVRNGSMSEMSIQ
jgi:UDP-2-acetamido-3-amino-2,3-dideoxy-glucuronate N-acetyltransferase